MDKGLDHSAEAALGDRAIFETGSFNMLLEAMGEAVVITTVGLDDPGPSIMFVNTAFERLSGYSRREVVGQTPRIFQGPDTSRVVLDHMRAALKAAQTFEGETINYRKNGEAFLLRWAVVPIFDDFGKRTAWLSLQRAADSKGPSLEARATSVEQQMHDAADA